MVAQAWMLAEAGAEVHFVAFGNAKDFPVSHPRIHLHAVAGACRDTVAGTGWPLLRAVTRTLGMIRQLRRMLRAACEDADLLLAQLPPVLTGLWLTTRQGIPLVIDWHNLSAPMAALKLGPGHLAVRLLERMETVIARRAQGHFAVTKAFAEYLSIRFGRPVQVLPDRPSLNRY